MRMAHQTGVYRCELQSRYTVGGCPRGGGGAPVSVSLEVSDSGHPPHRIRRNPSGSGGAVSPRERLTGSQRFRPPTTSYSKKSSGAAGGAHAAGAVSPRERLNGSQLFRPPATSYSKNPSGANGGSDSAIRGASALPGIPVQKRERRARAGIQPSSSQVRYFL